MANAKKSNKPSIVSVGSCMIDFVSSFTSRFAKEGETVSGKKFITTFGGKGANQCVAAAKLGAPTALVARLGEDPWGKRYLDNLKSFNVNMQYVRRLPDTETGIAQVTVDENGASQIVIVGGANDFLDEAAVLEAQEIISNAKILLVQLETSVNTAIKAMELCKGISILNGAPAITKCTKTEIFKLPTIFCVNETEAEVFTGLPVTTVGEALDAGRKLSSMGCKNVIITLGELGCVLLDDKKEVHQFRAPKIECVDSTGAGDSFIGSLAYLLNSTKQYSLSRAIEIACMIAADSCKRPGTQQSFPDHNILSKLKV